MSGAKIEAFEDSNRRRRTFAILTDTSMGSNSTQRGDLLAFFNFDSEKTPKEAIAIMRVEGGPHLKTPESAI